MSLTASPTWALDGAARMDLTHHPVGYLALALFGIAYLLVMAEELTGLRKSKPVVLLAGVLWAVIAWLYRDAAVPTAVADAVRENILDYAELLLFLLVAMTYISALEERRVFQALSAWLTPRGFSYRQLFWVTGVLAFFISPLADNLTTALLMCAVVLAVGAGNRRFISLACINLVVAANAGGAFSPFGDITTLMVWQKGRVDFWNFFALFLPAAVNFLVPAALMHWWLPKGAPPPLAQRVHMRRGARRIMLLFALTIATAVGFFNVLHLPPMLGMMTGLAYLQFLGFYLKKSRPRHDKGAHAADATTGFDVFALVSRAEWDTLLFFYGVVLCVGALGFIGYLELASKVLYSGWGPTPANITIGVLSAVVDNIPLMFAVLSMNPPLSQGQWLLVTLTAGVGGSLLSIGSAAGVALMGQARGHYTFLSHLRWTWAVALGYAASIAAHFWINGALF
ncbi:MAG: sodium:proton antiporter NhaD [Gammaproteobacteria bacterium]